MAPHTTLGDGRYRLERRLGAGGMASVWLAVDKRLNRPVAVKVVADALASDERWVRRFTREARAAAALSHRGVVSVYDYGVEGGRPFLVMEYVSGGTLADRLDDPASARPDAETATRQLLEALSAVHDAGILHRDVKPANLLLDEHDHLLLTDFGIAQTEGATALTQTGMIVGTLRFLAPEVVAGRPATVQSDLFSAGVVIRELARERATPRLTALVATLTAPEPGGRPDSAAAAARLLDRPGAGDRAAPTAGDTLVMDDRTGVTRPLGPRGRRDLRARAAGRGPRGAAGVPNGAALPADDAVRRWWAARTPEQADRLRRLAPVGAAVVLIVLLVALLSGGSGPSTPAARAVSAPAPARAPLTRQLGALDGIVSAATQR